ncbi:FAD dependent oxidoreductase [Penicillium paradoxum]|uniref:FAD dependent oxidoreductase n=1 Tax=Penicillium paradoxum TaxID=176176 RepID=UPI002548C301|nr:FAD dependent oxidoreductase [Penicillium paradoxum]KAJ5774875.1 FAD dependent oxidoreductase [Penicillium paradoxum]
MSTVILGGGIIGASIGYYLSANQPEGEIHIIEQSPELFTSASGYAAGFLARDWFEPSLAPLAALSFDMHHELAATRDGNKKWGFMKGTAYNLDTVAQRKRGGPRGDDWLRTGTSRAETASGSEDTAPVQFPEWLTKQKEGILEKISQEGTVAQADPLRLSQFLMDDAISRGVKLHNPSQATAVIKDGNGMITGVKIVSLDSNKESIIPCTNLVLSVGSWTPQVLRDLFPSSRVSFDISPLAGYSLVVRSPRYTMEHERNVHGERSDAVFTTHPPSCGFSPEIFLREGGEIYIAGLNNTTMKLPSCVADTKHLFDPAEMQKLKDVAVRLMGEPPKGTTEATDDAVNTDDLEIVREGLCFRPVGTTGVPTIGRVEDHSLGGVRASPKGGVFIASGHGPWGISLSLGTGKIVSEMIKKQKLSVDVSGLAVQDKGPSSKL